jgi:hypothetical protein
MYSWKTLVACCLLAAASADIDSRDMFNGSLIHTWDYSDQPYCVVVTSPHLVPPGAKSLWVCAVTVNDGAKEGSVGEHIVSVRSSDQGLHWSAPLALEDDRTIDNAYSTITLTPSGRIYVTYNMNLDNVTTLNNKPITRLDELGHFVMRYSDDGAATVRASLPFRRHTNGLPPQWSAERYEVPYRTTAVDRANSFEGKTRIMWSVDQVGGQWSVVSRSTR